MLPACRRLYPTNDYYYVQDGASSHISDVAQAHVKEDLGRRFVDKKSWPQSSPDCSALDYYFWNEVKQKVYGGRRLPFKDLKELKLKIKQVWRECCDIDVLRMALLQFRPGLKKVVRQERGTIKQNY